MITHRDTDGLSTVIHQDLTPTENKDTYVRLWLLDFCSTFHTIIAQKLASKQIKWGTPLMCWVLDFQDHQRHSGEWTDNPQRWDSVQGGSARCEGVLWRQKPHSQRQKDEGAGCGFPQACPHQPFPPSTSTTWLWRSSVKHLAVNLWHPGHYHGSY